MIWASVFDIATGEIQFATTVSQAKASARRQMRSTFKQYQAALTAGIPEGERLSWAQKEAAARAVLTAGWAPSAEGLALLDAELAVTQPAGLDVDRDELAARIVARADAYRAAAGRLAGVRRRVEAAIDAATTVAEVEAAVALLSELGGE